MNYNIIPYESAGEIKFNYGLSDITKILGSNYEISELDFFEGKQFYYPSLSLKIILDKKERVSGIFFYKENPKFHQVLYEGVNIFDLNYHKIKSKFVKFEILEDSESLVIIDLGLSFYFFEEKKKDIFPEEVGIFRKDLRSFYIESFK